MKKMFRWLKKLVIFGISVLWAFALSALLIVLPVMLLWNWLMPDIFGLTTITFWQALGLCFLSALLVKSSSSSSSSGK